MKRWIGSMWAVGILTLASVLFSGAANAQANFRGSFVLPYQVQWRGVALSAGKYCVTIGESSGLSESVVILRGGPHCHMGKMFVVPLESERYSGRSSLIIVTVQGKHFLRSLRLGSIGKAFLYAVPPAKNEGGMVEAVKIIPVRTTAG